ncbi:uncharacterized protein Z520_04232 [Fonsecaea multimorphosa CBS 102226]|uniref:E3 ubiquitin-protein ligase listerin n=1 Tax=Fonsecaea multimorphosa CBS 102226 TaxID=1442371 RepID=A0A0D2K8S6_9EURO|nr:uncharacterized protein Z520_04232 [Fonsecaea multimorphosa CBS 102226]KIX99599.1 hypothetical protein Z520_04232 [Fonsecaea multimorphosa CBS 102226]OAL26839.1 hypothetical protein AYO22_04006 [Fonsecaea multimorphosa]
MSKKFKSQASASSARAASAAFGSSSSPAFGFGPASQGFQTAASSLSYVAEQPDLSTVSNPNLVVSLRNLSKKDSTTKAKALEELQDYVSSLTSGDNVDSGLLQAWVKLYPRTSIDNARRVRQLAHALQGSLTALSGKRMAPHLPNVIGAWLSGCYDNDRLVARTSQESVGVAFATDDKRRALWKVYRNALLDYANDAILVQTPKTLSDERSTTPDDSEAKFVRVAGNAMQMLSQTIKINFVQGSGGSKPDISESLGRIVVDKRLWEFSSHEDPILRRAVCNLASICADTIPGQLDWKIISACFVGKALNGSQLGSSRQLSETLVALTSVRPEVWTTDYSSKTAASKRLFQYLRKGSQRGPADFWIDIALLLKKIPVEAWSAVSDDGKVHVNDTTTLLESLRTGITSSDEPRQNLQAAWSTYVDLSFWASHLLGDDQSRASLLEENVLPLVRQYVVQDPKQNTWDIPRTYNVKITASILISLLRCDYYSSFDNAWVNYCEQLSTSMKLSLPESSKDFVKSQDEVIAQANRMFRLKPLIVGAESLLPTGKAHAVDVIQESDNSLINAALQLLKARNGKPYGAAAVLEAVTSSMETITSNSLREFLDSDAIELLGSPSAEYLSLILLHFHRNLTQAFTKLMDAEKGAGAKALARLLGQATEDDLLQNPHIEPFIIRQISSQLENGFAQDNVRSVLMNAQLVRSNLHKNCCQAILIQLSPGADPVSQLAVLRFLLNMFSDHRSASSLFSEGIGNMILSKLLVLSDSDNVQIAELATSLINNIKTLPTGASSTVATSAAVIADQLSGSGIPLSIFSLIDLAKDTLRTSPSLESGVVAALIPSANQWSDALAAHISAPPPLSLSITNPLHGLVFMIRPVGAVTNKKQIKDSDEFSLLFRLVLYVTKMLLDTDLLSYQSEEQLETLYTYYPLALQFVNQKLTLEAAGDLWQNTSDEVTEEAAESLAQGNSLVQKWARDDKMLRIWIEKIRSTKLLDPQAFYYSLTFTDVGLRSIDEHGLASITSTLKEEMKDMYRSEEVARSASLICTCRDYLISSPEGRKLLNELIAMGTDLKLSSTVESGLQALVLLDLLLNGQSESLEIIPSQRQIFLMQTLERVAGDASAGLACQTMAMKLLEPVVTATKDIYGDHWGRILQNLVSLWRDGSDLNNDLPLLHASLRVYGRLRDLANAEDANEDLIEAWKASRPSLEEGLLHCLHGFDRPSNEINQPRQITAELLRRQLSHIDVRPDKDLYSFLSSPEAPVRRAAYDLLHRSIPSEQEQTSLDVALESKVAHLPPELLGVLSDTANPSDPGVAASRQIYLLSWHLVFDHFPTASYKLRDYYVTDIKEKAILGSLLDLLCDICRITSSRPLDASKIDIKSFELGTSETDEQEEQHLAMHLYYCCLLYLPGPTRSWFIEQKNRIKSPLEAWTQKYFAPALISAAAGAVSDWVRTQSQDEADAPLTVKTSLSGSEVVASIAVDPESPAISLAISLPKTYPLDSPTVSSRTRVGVSEKNWQSWLRTFQIIIFSTGSIVEGLVAFRRNVQGALKGQSECAICYSIIGTDMQTPNKRCGTCRNTFHGACLFRWFKSSNSSSCPLCRNNFNYA